MILIATLRQQVGLIFLLAVCGYALWKGRAPERLAALMLVVAWVASAFLTDTQDWFSPQTAVLAIDALLFLGLLWLAVWWRRLWAVAAAAVHGLSVLCHLARLADPQIWPQAYLTAIGVFSLAVVGFLAIGVWLEVPRAGRRGP